MTDRIREKLQILADAAKYDVSCSSSGSDRKTKTKGWEIPDRVFAIAIPKTAAVSRSLKFYLAMCVFMTALIAYLDVQMMSNELHLQCKKWSI